ncbi:indolepyruvate ferredoxin oxidoreductase subunit alpha [Chloroflexota bacterium]
MTHIITALCNRHGGCVDVCPVACIVRGKPNTAWSDTYIDPATCIDCGACIPACPYTAIWPEEEVPDFLMVSIQQNYDFFQDGPGYDWLPEKPQ